MADGQITFKQSAIFRLKWLCEAEIYRLEKFIERHKDHTECEDDVADASNDLGLWINIVSILRDAHD